MTRIARKRHHKGYTHIQKKYRTRRKTKDLDQIDKDLQPAESQKLLNQEIDHDKPGSAQHYCLHCARYFIDLKALKDHFRSKLHKRRMKALEVEPYTQKEADAAGGLGTYHPPKRRKITTQEIVEDAKMDQSEVSEVKQDK
ncbi:zinc finger protein 593-like [Asterias amurensis]|uniref:zinc finger protein 593-like n=1 Tax=Asterias amurensis TaxID=7602 RepID=UPI003AB634FB